MSGGTSIGDTSTVAEGFGEAPRGYPASPSSMFRPWQRDTQRVPGRAGAEESVARGCALALPNVAHALSQSGILYSDLSACAIMGRTALCNPACLLKGRLKAHEAWRPAVSVVGYRHRCRCCTIPGVLSPAASGTRRAHT